MCDCIHMRSCKCMIQLNICTGVVCVRVCVRICVWVLVLGPQSVTPPPHCFLPPLGYQILWMVRVSDGHGTFHHLLHQCTHIPPLTSVTVGVEGIAFLWHFSPPTHPPPSSRRHYALVCAHAHTHTFCVYTCHLCVRVSDCMCTCLYF